MGPPKAGKSFLAWTIASALANGEPVLGHPTPTPQKVLYVQLDTKEAAWTERLRKFDEHGVDLNLPNLRLIHQDDMVLPLLVTSAQGVAWWRTVLSQEDPAVVIIDVLRESHEEDENDSTSMKKVFDAMEPIFAGRTVLLVHHTRKTNQDDRLSPDPVSLSRGSSYITGRVDGYWLLHGEAPNRKLVFESRFMEQTTTTARQQTSTGLFTFPDLDRDKTLALRLHAVCAAEPHKTHGELYDTAFKQVGVSRAVYYRILAAHPCATHRGVGASVLAPRNGGTPKIQSTVASTQ